MNAAVFLRRLLLIYGLFAAVTGAAAVNDNEQSVATSSAGEFREYCNMETFRPRCRQGEVIVMETALFGRMRVGRCIVSDAYLATMLQYDPTSLGCSADVLSYVDRVCSGKQSCEMMVPNAELHKFSPCSSQQLTLHLEASYTCVSVVDDDRSCSVSVSVGSRLHISTSTTIRQNTDISSRRCGSRDHPWMLEAQTGQQINISLLDFNGGGRHVDTEQSTGQNQCRLQYGYIVDKTAAAGTRNNVSICASGDRHKLVHTSKSNSIEIVLSLQESTDDKNILLAFEAVGCSNLVPPPDAWLKRSDNEATIGCYLSRHRWTLRCVDNQWKGTIGTCSNQVQYDKSMEDDIDDSDSNSSTNVSELKNLQFVQVLSIVATSFVGLAVCLIIIFVGIGCARRYRLTGESKYNGSADVRNLLPANNDVNNSRSVNTVKSVYREGQQQQQQQHLPQYFVLDPELVADHNSRIIPADGSC